MADTKISALSALTGANVAAGDEFVLVDKSDTTMAASGTDKRIVGSEVKIYVLADPTLTGTTLTLADAQNIVVNATTGTKIGTATSQKLAFFNSTPIVQVVATTDLGVALSDLGLRAAGTAYPITTSGAVGLTGTVTITDVNVVLGTTTGTKFGTATTQKLGFFNSTPIVQPAVLTQTYSTADATLVTLTAATLTDSSGGTADTTLAAVEASYTQSTLRNNFADLAAMVNKNTADHVDLAQFVNSAVDKLQSLGLLS